MICYSLRDSIPCDKICKDIAAYIEKHKDLVNKDSLLVINITNISRTDNSLTPLLEYESQK